MKIQKEAVPDLEVPASKGDKMEDFEIIKPNIKNIARELKEVYSKGADEGYTQGYAQGVKDGNIADGTLARKIREAYDNGLNDAWECARKMVMSESNGGYSITKMQKAFNNLTTYEIITTIDVKEAIDKLEKADVAEWIIDYQKHRCRCSHCGFIQTDATKHFGECGYTMKNTKVK